MNTPPSAVNSRAMRSWWAVRPRAVPATNAPMIGASWALLAAAEKPKVTAAATAPTVAADVALAPMRANRRGTTATPTAMLTTRNPAARPMVEAIPTASTDPCSTTRVTTVRITRPSTSSATAAPRTMRASVDDSALRSPNTRAVMPTLVAAMAAPRKREALVDSPRRPPARNPDPMGRATPITATIIEARPTRRSSSRSVSMPTVASRMMTPTSARIFVASVDPTSPRTDGPMRMPAVISPMTAGTRMRSNSSAANLATTRITARSRKIDP